MTNKEALEIVIGTASTWAENAEEDFPRRLAHDDSDENLETLLASDKDAHYDLEYMQEVRDVWLAIEKLQPLLQMDPR